MSAVLDAALTMAGHGLPVFPLPARSKVPSANGHGFKDATVDGGALQRKLIAAGESCNLGVATGSWGFVLDSDGPKAKDWLATHDPLPKTWTVRTSRGGHRYFRCNVLVPSIPKDQLAPEVEIKGVGGYVLCPPSIHPSGQPYEWMIGPDDMPVPAEAPRWLLDILLQYQKARTSTSAEPIGESIPDGQRNKTLASLAGTMRRRGASEKAILEALLIENAEKCQPPLDESVVRGIARSISRYPPSDTGEIRGNDPDKRELASSALINATALHPRPIKWIWKNRIARGKMTVAGGDPGSGKSMLSTDWASRMSTGRKWPDGTQAPTCKCALVSAEDDPEDTIIPRLIAHGADLSMITFPGTLDLSTGADAFFKTCKAAAVEVVFIDPISAFVGPDTNTWRDSDMRRFLKPIAAAAAETNIAVVLIIHLTKANGVKALYRFQGSIAQAAAPRMAFLIAALPSDPEVRVMAAVKNNIGQKAESLSYRISSTYVPEVADDIGRVVWLGAVTLTDSDLLQPESESKALDRAEEFLLDYLAKGPQPSKECEAAAKVRKIGHNTLWDAKKELGVRSIKEGIDRWLWALPSPRSEASPSGNDASGAFNSNPTPESHTNKDSSSEGKGTEASFHHGGTRCDHPHVRFADDLLTCQSCGQQRDPEEEWPA